MRPESCVECGGPLPKPARTGRPKRFCGEPCRRLVEYRIARLRRLLEHLDRHRIAARIKLLQPYPGDSERAAVKAIEAEIEFAEAKLRELVA